MKKDENVRVIDFLPTGKSEMHSHKRKPLAQVIGENLFSLLEITPREGAKFEVGEKVYIGEGVREKVDHIERRIRYEWLTPTAKSELPYILADMVQENEKRFVEFYNTCGAISPRQHKLERLPGIGKRHMKDILAERAAKPFESFEDLRKRVKNMPDPGKIIAQEIVDELKGESKYYLFVHLVDEERERR